MSTYTRQCVAVFGAQYTGQAANVGVAVKDTAGSVLIARSTAGVSESTVNPGTYLVALSFTDSWTGRIDWDIAGQTNVGAVEDFGPRPQMLAVADATATRVALALPAIGAGLSGGVPLLGETLQLLDANDIAAIWAAATRTLTSVPNVTVGGYAVGKDPAALLLALYTQSGSSALVGNVATFTSPDGAHTGTLTASPSWAAPVSLTWLQLT